MIMVYCLISYKFLNVWWLCLYRKSEHYKIVDQYLGPFYEYINTHKLKIELIRKVFGPLSLDMLLYLGYYKLSQDEPKTAEQQQTKHRSHLTQPEIVQQPLF